MTHWPADYVSKCFKSQDLSTINYIDNGFPIKLKVTINIEKNETVFNFKGIGSKVYSICLI
jgi:N-methylhydantoinase B/oxoprolinase/acetone carboxylase alpha subunit